MWMRARAKWVERMAKIQFDYEWCCDYVFRMRRAKVEEEGKSCGNWIDGVANELMRITLELAKYPSNGRTWPFDSHRNDETTFRPLVAACTSQKLISSSQSEHAMLICGKWLIYSSSVVRLASLSAKATISLSQIQQKLMRSYWWRSTSTQTYNVVGWDVESTSIEKMSLNCEICAKWRFCRWRQIELSITVFGQSIDDILLYICEMMLMPMRLYIWAWQRGGAEIGMNKSASR